MKMQDAASTPFSICLSLSVSLSLSLFPSLSNILFRHKLLTSMRRLEILCRYRVYIDTNLDGTSDGEIYPGFGRLMGHMCTLPETKRKHEELAMTRILWTQVWISASSQHVVHWRQRRVLDRCWPKIWLQTWWSTNTQAVFVFAPQKCRDSA